MNPIDMLFDENNNDPIVLYNESNEAVEFEQIALIPYEGVVYAILRPISGMEIAEDEALVFAIREEDGEEVLLVEDKDEIIDAVFKQYYEMLAEAGIL